MNLEQRKKVSKLQENLFTIRQLAGWNAEDLAAILDVTKQTIYNLERGKPEMSIIQYYAIRKVIDDELELQPENKALQEAIPALLDNDLLPEPEYKELQESLKTIAKGMSKSDSKASALALSLKLITAATAVTAGAAISVITKSSIPVMTSWSYIMRGITRKG